MYPRASCDEGFIPQFRPAVSIVVVVATQKQVHFDVVWLVKEITMNLWARVFGLRSTKDSSISIQFLFMLKEGTRDTSPGPRVPIAVRSQLPLNSSKEERVTLSIPPCLQKLFELFASLVLSPQTRGIDVLVAFVPPPIHHFCMSCFVILALYLLVLRHP